MPYYERLSAMLGTTRNLETRLAICSLFKAMAGKVPELAEVAEALVRLHSVQRRQDSLAVDIDAQLKVRNLLLFVLLQGLAFIACLFQTVYEINDQYSATWTFKQLLPVCYHYAYSMLSEDYSVRRCEACACFFLLLFS